MVALDATLNSLALYSSSANEIEMVEDRAWEEQTLALLLTAYRLPDVSNWRLRSERSPWACLTEHLSA